MSKEKFRRLEEKIAEWKRQLPPHSTPPAILQKLEDLEEELEEAKKGRVMANNILEKDTRRAIEQVKHLVIDRTLA